MTQKDSDRLNEQLRAEATASKPTTINGHRLIHQIARDIRLFWPKVRYAAEPYLAAMECLYTIDQMYFQDSARSVIVYFLGNAGTWRGEHSRRIKAELNAMLK